jgi:hypothetical protein
MHPRIRAIALVILWAAGCTGQPTDLQVPGGPSFAAGGKVDQTPRARLSYADSANVGTELAPQWVPAGYRGDGRLRDGTPGTASLSNEYQGDWCGVNANIGTGTSGQSTQFTFDPDQWWSGRDRVSLPDSSSST